MIKRLGFLAIVPLLFFGQAAFGQTISVVVPVCGTTNVPYEVGQNRPVTQDTTGEACSNVAVSASVAGFTPSASGARGTPLTVTTGDSSGNLPTGTVVIVTNVGTTNPMYCNVNGATATVSDQLITANGGWFSFTIPAAVTTLHCIATGGSTTANTVGGSGLATGTGGGSGGGGSGGNVNLTQVGGASIALGSALSAASLPVVVASDQGAIAVKAASGAIASGAIASGAIASGAVASGAYAAGSISDGANVTLGAKADAKNAATDTTAISIMSVLKEISSLEQAPASRAVTNAGTFAVQLSATPTIANGNGVVPTIAGAVYSATNGAYFNQLQGNVVVSATNPSFAAITDSTNKMAVKAASTAPAATDPAAVVTVSPNSGTANNATAGNGSLIQGIGFGSGVSEPSKDTSGNTANALYDLVGKTITSPYANRENYIAGTGTQTGTSATTIIAASGSASYKTYVTGVQCGRDDAGTTAIHVTLNDVKSTVLVLPNNGGGGGNDAVFATPLVTAANTAFTYTPSTSITTVYCNAEGYYGY